MNNNWQNRLYKFEQEPTGTVWQRIEAALKKEVHFPALLRRFKQEPGAKVWQHIEKSLDAESKTLSVTGRKPAKMQYYVAAAVVLLVFISTAIFLSNKTSESNEMANEPSATGKQNTAAINRKQPTANATEGFVAETRVKSNIEATLVKRKFSRKETGEERAFAKTETKNSAPLPDPAFMRNIEERIRHFDFTAAERYMVYMDGSGKIAKLPKKIFSLIHCSEVDIECKSNLQLVQEKVSSASLATDFFGFLQMLQHLQENQ